MVVKHVAPAVHQRSAKVGIEEIFLGDLPGDDLANCEGLRNTECSPGYRCVPRAGSVPRERRSEGKTCLAGVQSSGCSEIRLEYKPIDDAVFDLVGVAENVACIEAQDIGEVVHAGHVAVGDVRLDDVLQLVSSNRAIKDACTARAAATPPILPGLCG